MTQWIVGFSSNVLFDSWVSPTWPSYFPEKDFSSGTNTMIKLNMTCGHSKNRLQSYTGSLDPKFSVDRMDIGCESNFIKFELFD